MRVIRRANRREPAKDSRPAGQPQASRLPRPARQKLLARAADPDTSGWMLWRVTVQSRHPAICRALAANPSAPVSLLAALGWYGRWDVAVAVARNPRCPAWTQRRLSHSGFWAVRAAVAASPSSPPKVLRRLAGRHDARITMAVAANPALQADLIAALLRSPQVYVRGVAAAHPAAPADALRTLAEGMSEPAWVLRAIATNPSCPAELSDELLTWITIGGPGKTDPRFDPVQCTGFPASTETSPDVWYAEHARHADAERHPLWRVRAAVPAARKRLRLSTARELRRDPRPEVRRTVAGFTGVLPRDVREMLGDADPAVARIAARVRSANRRRFLRRRLPLYVARLAPFGLVVGVLIPVFTSAGGTPTPPVTLSETCALTSGWLTDLSRPAAARVPGSLELPDGGWLACGPITSAAPEAIFMSTGSSGLTVLVADTVILPDGKTYTDAPFHLAAARKGLLSLSGDPSVVVVTITPDDKRSRAVSATLTFLSAPL
jgi:hypothetical protein